MNTPTHLLIAAAAFARPDHPRRQNASALGGGLLPDLSLYLLVAFESLILGLSLDEIFRERYFSPLWQGIFAIDNSAPLYAALLGLGVWLRQPWLWALAGAALLHIAMDFPLHHDDGRAHLQPFTDWVFQSPVSYWDPAHYAGIVAPLEILLALGLCVLLWLRFQNWPTRLAIGLAAAAQLSTGALWALLL